MGEAVNIYEAKSRLSELVERAARGLLVVQAQIEGLAIVTADEAIATYDVSVVDAMV